MDCYLHSSSNACTIIMRIQCKMQFSVCASAGKSHKRMTKRAVCKYGRTRSFRRHVSSHILHFAKSTTTAHTTHVMISESSLGSDTVLVTGGHSDNVEKHFCMFYCVCDSFRLPCALCVITLMIYYAYTRNAVRGLIYAA